MPPATSVAPWSMPDWMYARTRVRWRSETSGPSLALPSYGSPTAFDLSSSSLAMRTASSWRARGTSMRVHDAQVWPLLMNAWFRLARTAFSKSASSRITLADLPPSSSDTFFTVFAASSATRRPAAVEPVNETMSTSGCVTIASPTTGPEPDTKLNTPFGSEVWLTISANMKHDRGTTSDGFSTTVQPAASAGPTF